MSGQVATSLSVLQPLTNFSFTSIVDEVIDRIGLTVPPQPRKDDDPTRSRAESLESARTFDTQFRMVLKELCEADKGGKSTKPLWYKPDGLHLDYTKDFESRLPKYIAPALPLAIFKSAEEEMSLLQELAPQAPSGGLAVMGADELWQEINSVVPAERKRRFKEILEAQRRAEPLPPPLPIKPPVPPAPEPKPKEDPNLTKPDGGGGPGGPKDQEENKPFKPPKGWPGKPHEQPGEEPDPLNEPRAEDLPESGKDPSKMSRTKGKPFPIKLVEKADTLKQPRTDKVDPI